MLTLTLSSQDYMVGDAPFIKDGVITDDKTGIIGSSELLFVTIRATNNNNAELLRESKATLKAGSFDFKFKDPITRFQFGKMWARAFYRETTEITLDGNISEGGTTANLTVVSGSVPDKGHCLIDDEVCLFTKLSDTSIEIDRGIFETLDADHLSGATVGFSTNRESPVPDYGIEFETQEGDLFRFRNAQFRGGIPLDEFLRQ